MNNDIKERYASLLESIDALVKVKVASGIAEKMKNWTVEIGGEPVDIDDIDFEGEVICVNLHQSIKVVEAHKGIKF